MFDVAGGKGDSLGAGWKGVIRMSRKAKLSARLHFADWESVLGQSGLSPKRRESMAITIRWYLSWARRGRVAVDFEGGAEGLRAGQEAGTGRGLDCPGIGEKISPGGRVVAMVLGVAEPGDEHRSEKWAGAAAPCIGCAGAAGGVAGGTSGGDQ